VHTLNEAFANYEPMKCTDYAAIAHKYDQNLYRLTLPRDDFLAARLRNIPRRPFIVLGLACGTGNWLARQRVAFSEEVVRWIGLDASLEMLAVGRAKLEAMPLLHGRAEELPFGDGELDYGTPTLGSTTLKTSPAFWTSSRA
jgi:ubiquinone/menaquinone biosynthesis C-methylase UbiE